jgi:hypothetical protein
MTDMVIGGNAVAEARTAEEKVLLFARMCLAAIVNILDRMEALFDRLDRRPFTAFENDGISSRQVFVKTSNPPAWFG